MPALTIGIPVYNEEAFLARTIESALAQTFTDFELVVSDNCSTDASYEIAQQYARRDRRVRPARHARNIGPAPNFRHCLDVADTRYFVWLGAHDLFAPGYLAAAVGYLEGHPGHVLAYPRASLIDRDDRLVGADVFDDIDTAGRSRTARLLMVARRLHNCESIHGVFRTAVLKRAPFRNVFGQDMLIVFSAASHGQVKLLDVNGLSRRIVRQETSAQALARWESMGLFATDGRRLGIHADMTLEHVRFVRRSPHFTRAEKLVLSVGVPIVHARRFDRAILPELLLWGCGVRHPGALLGRVRRLLGRTRAPGPR